MAIKNIIWRGFGFTPGSIGFIPTRGFTPATIAFIITAIDATWNGTGEQPEAIYRNVSNSTNPVTIAARLVDGVQQKIDGADTFVMNKANQSIWLKADGQNNLMKFE